MTNEHVHHINENKRDNRLENLQVLSKSEHARLHGKMNPIKPTKEDRLKSIMTRKLNPKYKLSHQETKLMFEMLDFGESVTSVAFHFGIARSTLRKIRKRANNPTTLMEQNKPDCQEVLGVGHTYVKQGEDDTHVHYECRDCGKKYSESKRPQFQPERKHEHDG